MISSLYIYLMRHGGLVHDISYRDYQAVHSPCGLSLWRDRQALDKWGRSSPSMVAMQLENIAEPVSEGKVDCLMCLANPQESDA